MKQLYFYNKTDVPIMINYWLDEIWVENICCEYSIKIEPGEKRIIHSSLGEWNLHSNFSYDFDKKRWLDKGFNIENYIGKFNVDKNIFIMEYDNFCFQYIETLDEDGLKIGKVHFCYKKIKID